MSKHRIRWVGGLVALIALSLSLIVGGLALAQTDSEAPLPPQVVDTVPLVGEELALDGTVTLYFDLPMNQDSVAAAFSVTPEIAGDGSPLPMVAGMAICGLLAAGLAWSILPTWRNKIPVPAE